MIEWLLTHCLLCVCAAQLTLKDPNKTLADYEVPSVVCAALL